MQELSVLLSGGPRDKQRLTITAEEFERGVTYVSEHNGKNEVIETATYIKDGRTWFYIDESEKPNFMPTAGRVVWYMPTEKQAEKIPGFNFKGHYSGSYLPGMVVRGFEDGKANIKVFAGQFDFYVEGVPFGKAGKFQTWRWPMKTIAEQLMDLIK